MTLPASTRQGRDTGSTMFTDRNAAMRSTFHARKPHNTDSEFLLIQWDRMRRRFRLICYACCSWGECARRLAFSPG